MEEKIQNEIEMLKEYFKDTPYDEFSLYITLNGVNIYLVKYSKAPKGKYGGAFMGYFRNGDTIPIKLTIEEQVNAYNVRYGKV